MGREPIKMGQNLNNMLPSRANFLVANVTDYLLEHRI